jgi:UDP-N-acetylmuramyl-tripeptide synthetase
MGTIDTVVGSRKIEARMTTSEAPDIQKALRSGLQQNCRHGVIEVSSHALHLNRVFGCHFPVAVFTNLSQDHLDFHRDLDKYFEAKRLLFQLSHNPGLEYTVTNNDDHYGRRLRELSEVPAFTYGRSDGSDIRLRRHKSSQEGLELQLEFFGRPLALHSPLIGNHNLYNIMAAAAACSLLGVEDDTIRNGIRSLTNVPGRFERVQIEAPFTVILDFAHTPDALENALKLAAEISQERVICVFGCGGDRDRGKRPLMGKIAVEKADFVILTSDNPRSEDPESIISDIEKGIPSEASNFERIVDRKEAILRALELARAGDLILLAGKGHEIYQEIQGKKTHFDEREIVKETKCWN